MTAPAARLAAPPAASEPVCRHCGGPHSIHECPRVLAAFGPIVHRQQRGQRANRIAARAYKAAHSKPAHKPAPRPRAPVVRTCARCGQPIPDCNGRRKYHPECAADIIRADCRQRYRAKRAAAPPRTPKIIMCACCGQPTQRTSNNTKYCPNCAAGKMRAASRDLKRAKAAARKAERS